MSGSAPIPPTESSAGSSRRPGSVQRRLGWLARRMGVLLVAAAAWITFTNSWIVLQARPRVYASANEVPARSVAIVLGARVYSRGLPSATLEDRLASALELYRKGKVQRILVSGDHSTRYYDEVNVMLRWLVARGVPERDVFSDHAGLRTLDSMDRAARVFAVKDAIVCTQRFHLARSLFLAERAGIDAVGLEADRRTYATAHVNTARELLARTVAWMDSYLLFTRARHAGPALPVSGDARASRG